MLLQTFNRTQMETFCRMLSEGRIFQSIVTKSSLKTTFSPLLWCFYSLSILLNVSFCDLQKKKATQSFHFQVTYHFKSPSRLVCLSKLSLFCSVYLYVCLQNHTFTKGDTETLRSKCLCLNSVNQM